MPSVPSPRARPPERDRPPGFSRLRHHRWLAGATAAVVLVLGGTLAARELLPYAAYLAVAGAVLGTAAIALAERADLVTEPAPAPVARRARPDPLRHDERGPFETPPVAHVPVAESPEPPADPIFPVPPLFDVGDRLWTAWSVTVGELPVALADPLPESPFVPDDLPSLEFAPAAASPSEPAASPASGNAPAGGPETPGSLDGPEVGPPLPALEGLTPPLDLAAGGFGPGGVAFSELELEAMTPLPPHLRPPFAAPTSGRSRDLPRPRTWDSRCATCRNPVRNAAGWQRCPECHRAMCHGCLVRTLRGGTRALCTDCRAQLPHEESIAA